MDDQERNVQVDRAYEEAYPAGRRCGMAETVRSQQRVPLTRRYMSQLSPVDVRIQAFGIVQNYLADGSLADLYACVGVLGEDHLLECIGFAAKQNQPAKLRVAVSDKLRFG